MYNFLRDYEDDDDDLTTRPCLEMYFRKVQLKSAAAALRQTRPTSFGHRFPPEVYARTRIIFVVNSLYIIRELGRYIIL